MTALQRGLLVDLEPMTQAYNTDNTWRYINSETYRLASLGDYNFMTRARAARTNDEWLGPYGCYFMIRARDGQLIGSVGFNSIQAHCRFGEVGIWIGEHDYWGGGHGTDAMLLLIAFGFDWLDLRRIGLTTMVANPRAMRSFEKCGFVRERVQREATLVDGAWVDIVEYGLLRDEWPGRAALVEQNRLRERAAERYGDNHA